MNAAEKDFSRRCLRWFSQKARDLPWRKVTDPYAVWVSEVMLQQTTVKTVIPYFERWMKIFPRVEDLAAADEMKVLKLWEGLGYYHRARCLHRAARMICDEYGGQLPKDFALLSTLPGFGEYTTAAVLSIAFEKSVVLVDGNVRRVLMRYLGIDSSATPAVDKDIKAFLEKAKPKKRCGDFNQALMEIGALLCRRRNPLCGECPLNRGCVAFSQGLQSQIPRPRHSHVERVHAVVGVIERGGRYFFQQRPRDQVLGGLWEFPGGKIEATEDPSTALERELAEELGVSVVRHRYLGEVRHAYTRFHVRLKAFWCEVSPQPSSSSHCKWLSIKELDSYPLPAGTVKIINQYLKI